MEQRRGKCPGVSVVVFFTKWCAEAVAGKESSGSYL